MRKKGEEGRGKGGGERGREEGRRKYGIHQKGCRLLRASSM